MKDIISPPRASSHIEALRDIGYSLKSAVADIIDNSISASASKIELFFEWKGKDSSIAIIDDGDGMSAAELIEAMRPSNVNPLESRDRNDLGRFGLGMKTASFSQCRKLTVISRRNGSVSGCCWDLDYVAEKDEWLLRQLSDDQIEDTAGSLITGDSGTLVLWENLDRLIDRTGTGIEANLYEKMDSVRKHLELVFHRYLKGEPGKKPIAMSINGEHLKPFDPFNSLHPATQHLQDEILELAGETIRIQPYILPHHSKISPADYEYYGGEGGYLRTQGFYVYRNSRLLISGTWFRLARQRELTKLARVKIDLPNSLDHLWEIDVRKSKATPPEIIRQRLKKVIDRITGGSTRIYTTRGRRLTSEGLNTVWIRKAGHGKIKYSINRDHPLLKNHISELNGQARSRFLDLLTLIEDQLPVDSIYSDVSGSPESLAENMIEEGKLLELAELFHSCMKAQGMAAGEIREQFEITEPFRNNLDRITDFLTSKEHMNA